MLLSQRLQSIAGWKGEPFVYTGPEPESEPFGIKIWNDVNAVMGLTAMLEERLLVGTKFSATARTLILADFTEVVLNDIRHGGSSRGEMLNAELFIIGPCDVVVMVDHDAVPFSPDSDAENGTARHVGYDKSGRCCLLHFTNAQRG